MRYRIPHQEEIISTIVNSCNPEKIVLFGSRAKGTNTIHSDIDIAIYGSKLSFREKRKLKEKVNEVSGIYTVDVVFIEDVDDILRKIIEQHGVVLWKK
jgi:predicted nucleotidyltransferase